MQEHDLIQRYFAPLACHPGAYGLLDDAAVLTLEPEFELVLTTDALVAGVHFFEEDPAPAVAQKSLRVNLSDLAAKAAEPIGFLLMLALPVNWSQTWLAGFADGLGEDARAFSAPLLGGDTVRAEGALTISITALGRAPHGKVPHRSGAQTGDVICVTGTIGDAALGLRLRLDPILRGRALDRKADIEQLLNRYLLPVPRLAAVEGLRAHATASMDVSDGLLGDLAKLLRASRRGGQVEVGRVPLSPAARAVIELEPSLLETALTGGDDYEVLCTVPEAAWRGFEALLRAAGVPATRIGTVTEPEKGLVFRGDDGAPLRYERSAYSHF